MNNFIAHQIEISERLFELMKSDHAARMAEIQHWAAAATSLVHKLEQRDTEIARLRAENETLRAAAEKRA